MFYELGQNDCQNGLALSEHSTLAPAPGSGQALTPAPESYKDIGTVQSESAVPSMEYSIGPGQYVMDSSVIVQNSEVTGSIPGIFSQPMGMTESETPIHTDTESGLIGLNNKITPNCERYSASEDLLRIKNQPMDSVNSFYTPAHGLHGAPLESLQSVSETVLQTVDSQLLINTRLNAPVESISEVDFNRFTHLFFDHQNPSNIIVDETQRGGSWSRNNFKDNYECALADNRGNNA